MHTDKQFSLQSTSIAQNPESDIKSLKLSKVKSQKFLFQNSLIQNPSQINPLQTLKNTLKLLELNPSQQQFILTHINQFKEQNNKIKHLRSTSALKRTPSIESKKKPPLPQTHQQNKPRLKSITKKPTLQHSPLESRAYTFLQPLQLPSQSSIIKTTQQAQNITKFFPQNTVKGFALMYKASQHKFSLKQFFKICGSTQNLLMICQTNKSKIIGAFSPISHQFTGKNGFDDKWGQKVRDPSKNSFIFSLTNNHKFEMKSQEHAIYRWRDKKYLIVGDWEFSICDGANLNKNCRTDNINLNYFNAGYKNSKESWMKLNGNEDPWFTTTEWQAWKVQFTNTEK